MSKYVLVDDNGVEYPTDSAVYRTRLVALGYKVKEDTQEVPVHQPDEVADAPATAVGSTDTEAPEKTVKAAPKPRARRTRAAAAPKKDEQLADEVPDTN